MFTFVDMKSETIAVRPDKYNPNLKKDLTELASKKQWSLNKYALWILLRHVKKVKKVNGNQK